MPGVAMTVRQCTHNAEAVRPAVAGTHQPLVGSLDGAE